MSASVSLAGDSEAGDKDSDVWSDLEDDEPATTEIFDAATVGLLTESLPEGVGLSLDFLEVLRLQLGAHNLAMVINLAAGSTIQKLMRTLTPAVYKIHRKSIRRLLDLGEIIAYSTPKRTFTLKNAKDWLPELQAQVTLNKASYNLVEQAELKQY